MKNYFFSTRDKYILQLLQKDFAIWDKYSLQFETNTFSNFCLVCAERSLKYVQFNTNISNQFNLIYIAGRSRRKSFMCQRKLKVAWMTAEALFEISVSLELAVTWTEHEYQQNCPFMSINPKWHNIYMFRYFSDELWTGE